MRKDHRLIMLVIGLQICTASVPVITTETLQPALQPFEQRMNRMEESMGDMKDMVGRVLQALAGLNAAAGLGPPTGGN